MVERQKNIKWIKIRFFICVLTFCVWGVADRREAMTYTPCCVFGFIVQVNDKVVQRLLSKFQNRFPNETYSFSILH